MRETTPKVRLIASPQVHWDEVLDYLSEIDGLPWTTRQGIVREMGPEGLTGLGIDLEIERPSDAELLVEYAGRRCYRSWVPGLNANVTKVREDSGEYLTNILKSKHGAVLEHAQFTFDFDQVSRVFTHELVRHRAGVAISQESLRYVRLTDLGFRIPDVLRDGPPITQMSPVVGDPDYTMPMQDAIVSLVERLEEFQRDAAEAFGLDDEGVPFHYKKEVTSALRRLAPLGLSTGMVWSANIRTLRHLIQLRTAAGAEEEIRAVFHQVGLTMMNECPLLFRDFSLIFATDEIRATGIPEWIPEWEKV